MAHGHDHLHHDQSGHDHAGHGHAHGGHHHGPVDTGDWRYAVGLIVNLAFVGVEFGAGLFSGSTALMADAGHNLSDVLGLAMAGGAAWLARRASQAAPPAMARPSTSDRLCPASAIRAVEPLNTPALNSTATKTRLTIRPTA